MGGVGGNIKTERSCSIHSRSLDTVLNNLRRRASPKSLQTFATKCQREQRAPCSLGGFDQPKQSFIKCRNNTRNWSNWDYFTSSIIWWGKILKMSRNWHISVQNILIASAFVLVSSVCWLQGFPLCVLSVLMFAQLLVCFCKVLLRIFWLSPNAWTHPKRATSISASVKLCWLKLLKF